MVSKQIWAICQIMMKKMSQNHQTITVINRLYEVVQETYFKNGPTNFPDNRWAEAQNTIDIDVRR